MDIVQKIAAIHIDAAIEIKAACSADPMSRHGFRLDVEKLATLKKQRPSIHCHFVLFDKSIAICADDALSSNAPAWFNWSMKDEALNQRLKAKGKSSPGIVESVKTDNGIVVWDIDPIPNAGSRIRRRVLSVD